MRVILALPAFNEEENLEPLIVEADRVFGEAGLEYSVVAVDDGSTDGTGLVLDGLAGRFPVRVIRHRENRGLGGAILTGLQAAVELASGADDIIVNMDADNTHSPAYIPEMARLIGGGADIVIASRYRRGSREIGVPLGRRVLSRGARLVFQSLVRLPGVRDYTCGYRAYRASLIDRALREHGSNFITRQGFACTDEILIKLSRMGPRIEEVPFVLRYDRKRSRSKLPFWRTVWETLKMLREH